MSLLLNCPVPPKTSTIRVGGRRLRISRYQRTLRRWSVWGAAVIAGVGVLAAAPATAATQVDARSSSTVPNHRAVTNTVNADRGSPPPMAAPPVVCPPPARTKIVTNTNDSGAGSLRAALSKVNNPSLNFDTIEFNIRGSGAHIISPTTALPRLTAPVVIDGYSQPGSAPATDQDPAELDIVVSMASGVVGSGLELDTDCSVVTGLVINDSSEHGLVVNGDQNTVTGSYFGTKHAGEFGAGNVADGILIGGDSNTIGGELPADVNLLSDNGENGIHVQFGTGTQILGNLIGTDAAGSVAMGNADAGILDQGESTTISGNVLSGNDKNGLVLAGSDANVTLNDVGVVEDSGGATQPLPNTQDGIVIPGENNVVGGEDVGNTVAANGANGVSISGAENTVAANFVGLDAGATSGLGNERDGILVTGTRNVIGGADSPLGNIASDNIRDGIHIACPKLARSCSGAEDNLVEHNLTGTDPAGLDPRPNQRDGIHIEASNNTTQDNLVQFNRMNGIEVNGDGNQLITNTIRYDALRGVEIFGGRNNPIVGNSIDQNGRLGIDLYNGVRFGVTPNDFRDTDTGANDLMNFPTLLNAMEVGGNTRVTWQIKDGLTSGEFQLEFFASDSCDGSGFGEGATPLGTFNVTTDGNGNRGPIGSPPLAPANPGQVVTATATLVGPASTLESTSEFSNCVTIP